MFAFSIAFFGNNLTFISNGRLVSGGIRLLTLGLVNKNFLLVLFFVAVVLFLTGALVILLILLFGSGNSLSLSCSLLLNGLFNNLFDLGINLLLIGGGHIVFGHGLNFVSGLIKALIILVSFFVINDISYEGFFLGLFLCFFGFPGLSCLLFLLPFLTAGLTLFKVQASLLLSNLEINTLLNLILLALLGCKLLFITRACGVPLKLIEALILGIHFVLFQVLVNSTNMEIFINAHANNLVFAKNVVHVHFNVFIDLLDNLMLILSKVYNFFIRTAHFVVFQFTSLFPVCSGRAGTATTLAAEFTTLTTTEFTTLASLTTHTATATVFTLSKCTGTSAPISFNWVTF